jgi:hypothetical protein
MFPLRKESDGYGSESEDNTRREGEDREYRGARAPTQDAFWREERQERGSPWDRESKEKQGNSGHRAYGQIEWSEARENYASTSTSGGEWETGPGLQVNPPANTGRKREEWSYRQGENREDDEAYQEGEREDSPRNRTTQMTTKERWFEVHEGRPPLTRTLAPQVAYPEAPQILGYAPEVKNHMERMEQAGPPTGERAREAQGREEQRQAPQQQQSQGTLRMDALAMTPKRANPQSGHGIEERIGDYTEQGDSAVDWKSPPPLRTSTSPPGQPSRQKGKRTYERDGPFSQLGPRPTEKRQSKEERETLEGSSLLSLSFIGGFEPDRPSSEEEQRRANREQPLLDQWSAQSGGLPLRLPLQAAPASTRSGGTSSAHEPSSEHCEGERYADWEEQTEHVPHWLGDREDSEQWGAQRKTPQEQGQVENRRRSRGKQARWAEEQIGPPQTQEGRYRVVTASPNLSPVKTTRPAPPRHQPERRSVRGTTQNSPMELDITQQSTPNRVGKGEHRYPRENSEERPSQWENHDGDADLWRHPRQFQLTQKRLSRQGYRELYDNPRFMREVLAQYPTAPDLRDIRREASGSKQPAGLSRYYFIADGVLFRKDRSQDPFERDTCRLVIPRALAPDLIKLTCGSEENVAEKARDGFATYARDYYWKGQAQDLHNWSEKVLRQERVTRHKQHRAEQLQSSIVQSERAPPQTLTKGNEASATYLVRELADTVHQHLMRLGEDREEQKRETKKLQDSLQQLEIATHEERLQALQRAQEAEKE